MCKKSQIDFDMVEVPKLEPSNEISGRRRKRRGTEFIETLQEKPNSCLDKNNSMKINKVQNNMHLANAQQDAMSVSWPQIAAKVPGLSLHVHTSKLRCKFVFIDHYDSYKALY